MRNPCSSGALWIGALVGGIACTKEPLDDCADTLSCELPAALDQAGAGGDDDSGATAGAAARSSASTGAAGSGATAGETGRGGASAAPAAAGAASGGEEANPLPAGAGGAGAAAASAAPSAGGAGGAGPASERGPCPSEGALACAGPAGTEALICRDGAWAHRSTCASAERCDSASGLCAPVVPACAERKPGERFCSTDQVLTTCGPDLVTREDTLCEGGCVAQERACAVPTCGDGELGEDEQCDDGNALAGDGCSRDCRHEPIALALGGSHSCALGANGVVKCWGRNDSGQLGLGDRDHRGDEPDELGEALAAVDLGEGRRARAIAAGSDHSCALLDDGAVVCWGQNDLGQLGLGHTEHRGDDPGELGESLAAVDLGLGRRALAIAAGGHTTCVLLDVGTIACWGNNDRCQCGSPASPAVGDEPSEMGSHLLHVDVPEPARAISVGDTHVCALTTAGSMYCWGDNSTGQLGVGDTDDRGDQPGEMDQLQPVALGAGRTATAIATSRGRFSYQVTNGPFSCAIRDDGALRCWGYLENLLVGSGYVGKSPNELGAALPVLAVPAARTVIGIEAGCRHVCALEDDGGVRCWGYDDLLAGGHEPVVAGEVPDAVPLGVGRRTRQLAVGGLHTCALLDDGTVKCWGQNGFGQLGVGDVTGRGHVVTGLGDALPAVDLAF